MSGAAAPEDLARIRRIIARMRAIDAELEAGDGVAAFNRMYLAVTTAVHARVVAGGFRDPRFLGRLTAVFAELYLDAYARAGATPPACPQAWEPLFEARRRPRIAGVQFALAGMNAHINYDLGVAVVDACGQLGLRPRTGSAQHADYLAMNRLLEEVAEGVKTELLSDLLHVADAALGRVDDIVSIWSIARARDAAWSHAEALAVLGGFAPVRDGYLLTLGRTVGLTGRALLVPVL